MLRIDRLGLLSVLAMAGVVVSGCGSSDKAGGQPRARTPIMLTLANPLPNSSEVDAFVEQVRRLSGGTIAIAFKNGWRHGQVAYETGLIGDVRAGKADLGVVGTRAWDSLGVSSLNALQAPFLIDSYALQQRVLTSPLAGQMLSGIGRLGLSGVGFVAGPLRYPLGSHPLLGPSGYSGQRIALQESRVGSATLRAFGATPVAIAAGGSIVGLDGIEQGISQIFGDSYTRTAKYLTANTVLWPRPLVVFANRKAWDRLTPAQQRILKQAALDAIPVETASNIAADRSDTASLCSDDAVRFVMATGQDLSSLHRAAQPIVASLERDALTRSLIANIDATRVGTANQTPPRCAPAPSIPASARELDGVWQYSVTYADLRAVGADPSEMTPTNVGHTTFVFDRGRFAMTTENPTTCFQAFGTFTISGNLLSQHFFADVGDGSVPPGTTPDLFTFRWSLYRDVLTVRRDPGGVSPSNGVAKPWRRVSDRPSLRYFSKRCPPPPQAHVG